MSNILTLILSFLLLYKYWALLAIFFISALAVPIPASTVLLAAGAFASQGYFSFWLSLLVIVGGNVAGDYSGYLLAKKYGRRILESLHIGTPKYLERLESFLRRHPASAIFLTRFAGTTDSLVNLLSGFANISLGKFLFYDVIGNIISNGGLLYAGYFLGIHWQDFTSLFGLTDYIFLGLIIVVALSLVVWHRNRNRAPEDLQ